MTTTARTPQARQESAQPTAEEREALLAEYGYVRARHDGIAEFRAKLLALLPISSGAGIGLLLATDIDRDQLLPVGVFGAIVTIGLFLYELRGIGHCSVLMRRGAEIEQRLGLPGGMWQRRLSEGGRVITTTTASRIVYLTVIAGWFYVAGYGFYLLSS